MDSISDVLDHPLVYRTWQAPFATKKLHPVVASGVLSRISSVLDVGCGPGTNTPVFEHVERYVGVDLNPKYIAYAKSKFKRDFRVRDVRDGFEDGETFDLVLMNSLMHHLDDDDAHALLGSIGNIVAPGGEVHVLDLVLGDKGLTKRMAIADRGDFPRTEEAWLAIVRPHLALKAWSLYDLGIGPIGIWRMIHLILARG